MRIKIISKVAYFTIMLLGGFSFLHIDTVSAASSVSTIALHRETTSLENLVAHSNPRLVCKGTGEISGAHPGWISAKAIKLTVVNPGDSTYGAYWCPAAAPNGQGFITYTLTSATDGNTCVTVRTECLMYGDVQKSSLTIMATDQTGSYPIVGNAIQNSGALDLCQENRKDCHIGSVFGTIPSYGNEGANAIKNCTFAAVANWEHVVLGLNPVPLEINAEFETSGGTDTGLTNDQVFYYWSEVGIGGVHLKEATPIFVDPLSIQTTVGNPKVKAIIA